MEPPFRRRGNLMYSSTYEIGTESRKRESRISERLQLNRGMPIAQNALQLWLYARSATAENSPSAQTVRLLYASLRQEPQRFGHIRSSHAPLQLRIFRFTRNAHVHSHLCLQIYALQMYIKTIQSEISF